MEQQTRSKLPLASGSEKGKDIHRYSVKVSFSILPVLGKVMILNASNRLEKMLNLTVKTSKSMGTLLRVSKSRHRLFLLIKNMVEIERVKRPKNEAKLLICPYEHCLKEF